jgi:hypothetical protein
MSAQNVSVIVDDLSLGSPGQQIVDRFLIGFARDAVFEKAPFEKVTIWTGDGDDKVTQQRRERFPRSFAKSRDEALSKAEAVVVVLKEGIADVLDKAQHAKKVFVYGQIAHDKRSAETIFRNAEERGVSICAGTVMSALEQLSPMEIPTTTGIGAQIREALIVAQGGAPKAELEAFDALAPILERNGGLSEIKTVRLLDGDVVWDAGDREWSWRMLASALSRTDKAQGNATLDGRTEDIVGLGLTQKMAKNPRARIIEHSSGLRTAVLVLDGVVGDMLVAVRAGRRLMPGAIYSTQLFQSPTPQQEEFSRLTAVITDFFQTGKAPWGKERVIIAADFAERLRK